MKNVELPPSSSRASTLFIFLSLCLFLLPVTTAADWIPQGPGGGGEVTSLLQAPDGSFYASLGGRGIYRSENRGRLWTQIYALEGSKILDLVICPEDSTKFYAATNDGIFRLQNAESELLAEGLPDSTPLLIRVDSSNPSVLYTAFGEGFGIYRSTDAGASWQAINNGFGNDLQSWFGIRSLVQDPQDPSVLYTFVGRLYRSTDGGTHWNLHSENLLFVDALAFFVAPHDSQTLYALDRFRLFYWSHDGGRTWMVDSLPGEDRFDAGGASLAVDPRRAGRLWIGTRSGRILRSLNHGENWQVMPAENLRLSPVTALLVDRDQPKRIFAGTEGAGVFLSGNSGALWKSRSTGLDGLKVTSIAVDPQDPQTIYAGTGGGMFKSTDHGLHWTAENLGMVDSGVLDVVIDPQEPRRLYAATQQTYYFSTDHGKIWRTRVLPGNREPRTLVIDPRDPSILYAGTSRGVLRSTNYGRKWRGWNGFDPGQNLRRETDILVADERGRLSVGRREGVLRGPADTENWFWVARDVGTGRILGLAQPASDPARLYAAVQLDDVYHSSDGGQTWQGSQDDSDLGNRRLREVVADPEDADTVYAVTWEHGIDRSTDGGNTWESIGLEAEGLFIYELVIDPHDRSRLYAGTNRGLFVFDPGN